MRNLPSGLPSGIDCNRLHLLLKRSQVAIMPAAANPAADHPLQATKPIHFGAFDVDLRAGELHKNGVKRQVTGAALPGPGSTAGTSGRDRNAGGTTTATLAFGHVC